MAVKTVSTLTALLSGIISGADTTDVTNKYVKYSEACFIPILQAANTVYTSPISSIGFSETAFDYYPGEVPTLTSSSSLTRPYIRFANVSKSLQSSGIFYASGGASTYSYYCSTNTSGIIWYPHYANDTSLVNGLTSGYRAVTIGFWFSPNASALSATTAQIFSVAGSTLTSSSTSNGRFVLAFRSGVLSYLAQSCNTGGSESTASYTAISSASTLSAGT